MGTLLMPARRLLDRVGRGVAARFRRAGRPALAWTARLTLAAVASYVVAEQAFPGSAPPLLAPLTALLVVQLTPVSLLVSGLDRVVSVVLGVGVAVLLTSAVGLSWWSLGLVVGIALIAGQVLRLGPNLLEVPISAMLVLGVGAAAAESAAGQRVAETLVGAAVGVVANLILPPRVVAPDAGEAIERLGLGLARLLEQAAADLTSERADPGWLAGRAGDWLGQARRLTHGIPDAGAALLRAEESRRLNLRALRTTDAGPGLRQGLEALEHSSVAVRSMFATIEATARTRQDAGLMIDPTLREVVAVVLRELAGGLAAFGGLVRQEALPVDGPPDLDRLRAALDGLHEARARTAELLLVDPRDPSLSQTVVSLVGTVERVQRELDLDERIRRLAGPAASRRPVRLPHLSRGGRRPGGGVPGGGVPGGGVPEGGVPEGGVPGAAGADAPPPER